MKNTAQLVLARCRPSIAPPDTQMDLSRLVEAMLEATIEVASQVIVFHARVVGAVDVGGDVPELAESAIRARRARENADTELTLDRLGSGGTDVHRHVEGITT